MGFDAKITVVSRAEIRRRHWFSDGLAKFDLHREWLELRSTLETFGRPLDLVLRGDRRLTDDEDDCEHALVTPALVKRIHASLCAISDEEYLAAIHTDRKKTGLRLRKYEHKDKFAALVTLRDAYRMAAEQDAYIEVFIC